MDNQILNEIKAVIDQYIIPSLQMDGGSISIVNFENNLLTVKLEGHCSCCPHAQATLKNFVEETIHRMVSNQITVISL